MEIKQWRGRRDLRREEEEGKGEIRYVERWKGEGWRKGREERLVVRRDKGTRRRTRGHVWLYREEGDMSVSLERRVICLSLYRGG